MTAGPPATEAQVRQYLELVGIEKATHDMLASTLRAMQATSAPYYPQSFWSDISDEFAALNIVSVYIPLLQKRFSQSEMQAALDFYKTPVGQKFLAVQPLLVEESRTIMRQKGAQIGQAVYSKHAQEIETAKKRYESEHGNAPEIQIPK